MATKKKAGSKLLPKNILSGIALILLVWTALNWLTMSFPSVFLPNNTFDDYPLVFKPFVPIDQMFPNPDNDMDGPYVIGTFFLPFVAALFSIAGYFFAKSQKKEDKVSVNILGVNIVVIALLLAAMAFGGVMAFLAPRPLPY